MLSSSIVAIAVGIALHRFFFIRGEHHLWAPTYVRLVCAAVFITLVSRARWGYTQAIGETMSLVVMFLYGLFMSIAIYRLAFHPLRKFRGPFTFKISKLWHVLRVLPSQQNYLILERLHMKYGDFVRTGESRMSICCRHVLMLTLGKDPASLPFTIPRSSRLSRAQEQHASKRHGMICYILWSPSIRSARRMGIDRDARYGTMRSAPKVSIGKANNVRSY